MKRFFFVMLVTIATGNLYAQYVMVDTVKLNNAYRALMQHPGSQEAQQVYFDAFPDTWMEYITTYQYFPDDRNKVTPYFVAPEQMDAFCFLNMIPDSLYYRKLVNIAVGARLDADAANYLKSSVKYHMRDHSELLLDALARLRKGHRFEFWEFYWSNIIDHTDIPEELNRLVELHKNCHPEDVQMMKDAFKYFYDGVNFMSDGYLDAD